MRQSAIVAKFSDIPDSFVKDALQVPLRESRALQVLVSANLFGANQGLVV
jgi:hypothetical protein